MGRATLHSRMSEAMEKSVGEAEAIPTDASSKKPKILYSNVERLTPPSIGTCERFDYIP